MDLGKTGWEHGSTTFLAAYGFICMLTFIAGLLVVRFK
jgi:hypothetical protein